ncbi:hypothetical protein [Pseudomonas phage vB_PaeM_PS119XW]|uniref:Uncharacterized protein n=1 Tax=Pseudomonas phage vB_PaeM_PS119XW TaxID=2601632 RepID=A0A5C1K8J2_9CAUD|nr:hypothetical protein PP933_gp082 [Pseudomonas phage vB_PaeM_PS119XW]QEM41811.1 hypothetical protein [Pseudomonas phage vB_PaeM_PS119XW]
MGEYFIKGFREPFFIFRSWFWMVYCIHQIKRQLTKLTH